MIDSDLKFQAHSVERIAYSQNLSANRYPLNAKTFCILIYSFALCVLSFTLVFAQDNNKLVTLTKQIMEAKTNEELHTFFNELKDLYLKDNKYNEFIEFLKSLSSKKKTLEPFTNYYIALSRYHQLKYLEFSQKWDEYFSSGNTYRQEITTLAQGVVDSTSPKNALYLYAKLLLWQLHKDQQDSFEGEALLSLTEAVLEYSKTSEELNPIKDTADKLLSYLETGKAKAIYKLYIDKLISSNLKEEELANAALGFYNAGNTQLSSGLYDSYIEKITKTYPKERLAPILMNIAKMFSYKDAGRKDELYAEAIFKKIDNFAGKEFFDEELMHLRAFNLEKIKDYQKAKDFYVELISRYPAGAYYGEANYKLGLIYAYLLRDIKSAKEYFEKLILKEPLNLQGALSLYQLGLFSQWGEDELKAKGYYNKLLEEAKEKELVETGLLAQERLKEIDEARPLDYNLRMFLDVSFKEEYSSFDTTKIELKVSPSLASKAQEVNIGSSVPTVETGCMPVDLQYLWSGDLGENNPSYQQAAFNTTYKESGTKIINLVVVSPTGIIDRSFDIVDIY